MNIIINYIKPLLHTAIFFLIWIPNVSSQEKSLQGDTTFWHRWHTGLAEKLRLKNFSTSENEFAFRFWNQGQVVEIIKDGDSITGRLINYIYRINRRSETRKDTIFSEITLDSTKLASAYRFIQHTKILDIPSDNMINGWNQGLDGITYIVEHAGKDVYWYKNYWTPSAQGNLREALIVEAFVNGFSDTLALYEAYNRFMERLPRNGCYNNGGMGIICYAGNSLELGYYGSTRLPIGYQASFQLSDIGRLQTDFGGRVSHRFGRNGDYDFSLMIGKGRLILNNASRLHDFGIYQYRKRQLDFVLPETAFVNHQFYYGLSAVNVIDLAAGVEYLKETAASVGGVLYASKWIKKPRISMVGRTSIFEHHVDYLIGISRMFSFRNNRLPKGLTIGIQYERFKGYGDLNLSVGMAL